MVYAVTCEYGGISAVHLDRNRDDQGAAGMPQALVNILVEVQSPRHLVELGQGGSQHRRIEVGFLSHEGPFR
jgi:hypothetical protein